MRAISIFLLPNRMCARLYILLPAILLLFTTGHAAECLDFDGDGWGWDGTQSCSTVDNQVNQPNDHQPVNQNECIDLDGDGWGWDGTNSCNTSNDPFVAVTVNPVNPLSSRLSESQWNEIDQTAATFGDTNDCRSRINNISSYGHDLSPCNGNCINTALQSHDIVRLLPGTYRITDPVRIGYTKTLIGADFGEVIIDASDVELGLAMDSFAVAANLTVQNSRDNGVRLGDSSLLHQVRVTNSGASFHSNSSGAGVAAFNTSRSCIVSVDVSESYNESGENCINCHNGGNADGFAIAFGSSHISIIDSHATRNSDDGFDFWLAGGSNFIYFSSAFRNGGTSIYPEAGDGVGFKLGIGNTRHYIYKSVAYENFKTGFDVNGNTIPPRAISSDSYNNGLRDWNGIERL